MRQCRQRGQSTMEYAMLIAIIIAAILTVQVYVRRGLVGRLKDTSDQQFGAQFNPYATHGSMSHISGGSTTDILLPSGEQTSSLNNLNQTDQYDEGGETVDAFKSTDSLF